MLSSPDAAEQPLGYIGPNWYASVMGTGIIANAAATLPILAHDLHDAAVVVWILAVLLLAGVTLAVGAHWARYPGAARSHARNPVMAQFYGAPPMAFCTVGAGALLVGHAVIGTGAAVTLDWILWSAGTLGGLVTAVYIPFLLFTEHEVRPDAAFGGWLMPIVPPMVSAATGALLIPHLAAGSARATMLYGCYALFGMSLVASLIVITLIWSRLAHFGSTGTVRTPTLWIVLGPLGQSITAAGLLGTEAAITVDPSLAASMRSWSLIYGVPVWGFGLLWISLALLITARTVRRGLPFALTWWSFTFPVGTFVTGTTQLAVHTGLPVFRGAAIAAFAGLLTAWVVVAARTAASSARGDLLRPPPPAPPPVAVKG